EFQGSLDAPDARNLWPADYLVRITYRLEAGAMRITAIVDNPDPVPLPFGLGFHPYFQMPLAPGGQPEDYLIGASAGRYWGLDESLPTGELRPVDTARDLRTPRPFPGLNLDDVLSTAGDVANQASLVSRALIGERRSGRELLTIQTSPAFREL